MQLRKHKRTPSSYVSGPIVALGLMFASVAVAPAQSKLTPHLLHAFADSGAAPSAVIQAKDGNLYGTTQGGGAFGGGTVFKMTSGGVLSTLHSFDCSTEGCYPVAALVEAGGSFYGTTQGGGASGGGTAFKMTPGGVLTTLHSFDCSTEGCYPVAALIQSGVNFYGTTQGGGAAVGGTIFKMTPAGLLTTLHSFDCRTEGCVPFAALIEAGGSFYGTTAGGGASGEGTVFKLSPAGVFTTLHAFDCSTEGCVPLAGLIEAGGKFYGTTQAGGAFGGGTVFKLTKAGILTAVHAFEYSTDGASPRAGLIQSAGNFYGTTQAGGAFGGGTVFKLTPAGAFATVYAFGGYFTDGNSPQAVLLQASDGKIYGTTIGGGATGAGTVFKLTLSGVLTTLNGLGCTAEGCTPYAALIQARDGNFYGTTNIGGSLGGGTAFKLTRGGDLTTMHSFDAISAAPNCSTIDGCAPNAIIQARDGHFYGTTYGGGAFGVGTVFKLTPGGALTILHAFECGIEGCGPVAAPTQDRDGNFYGTTAYGGAFNNGSIYKLTAAGDFTTLYSFFGSGDGCTPYAALIQASDGNFYGTTTQCGPTVYRMTPAGELTTLHVFDCSTEACPPYAALIQASDGKFYGTTQGGGAFGGGSVFRITSDGAFSTLHAFECSMDGCYSFGELLQASDGHLYGTTQGGGASGGGTVFQITLAGSLSTLHAFDCKTEGCAPTAALIQASDGRFYGTLSQGGPHNGGVVFRLVPNTLTALSAAEVWIGLKNGDDVGVRFDLRAEVYQNGTLIGSGDLASVAGGSSGFGNAKLQAVPLVLSDAEPVSFGPDDILSIKLYVRNACTGSGKNSGTARLWFNDAAANSRFGATIAERTRDYFLRGGFALSTAWDASKQSMDVAVGARCGSFVPFGTWSIVAP